FGTGSGPDCERYASVGRSRVGRDDRNRRASVVLRVPVSPGVQEYAAEAAAAVSRVCACGVGTTRGRRYRLTPRGIRHGAHRTALSVYAGAVVSGEVRR